MRIILMIPIAIFSLLLLATIDLVRILRGKPSIDEEWHETYVYGRISKGQGREE